MNWLEVSLVVDGELAEAVAEVLARFAPNGVVIESTEIEDRRNSEGVPIGPLRVCAYIQGDGKIKDTRQRIEEALWYLGRIQPIPIPKFKDIEETNWNAAWKTHYTPIPIGKNLIIVPPWLESPDPERIPIRIDPGMAFGTGTHPTTQLCLEMLGDHTPQGENTLDIGCGSGILSIAAIKLGAGMAFGVDIDNDAIDAAYENAGANDVRDKVHFIQGSVNEIRGGIFQINQAPLVMANILSHILIKILEKGLGNLVAPGGILLLSGILEEQVDEITTKTRDHGLTIIDQRMIEDWVGIALRN